MPTTPCIPKSNLTCIIIKLLGRFVVRQVSFFDSHVPPHPRYEERRRSPFIRFLRGEASSTRLRTPRSLITFIGICHCQGQAVVVGGVLVARVLAGFGCCLNSRRLEFHAAKIRISERNTKYFTRKIANQRSVRWTNAQIQCPAPKGYLGLTNKNGATRTTLGCNRLEIKQLSVAPFLVMGLL